MTESTIPRRSGRARKPTEKVLAAAADARVVKRRSPRLAQKKTAKVITETHSSTRSVTPIIKSEPTSASASEISSSNPASSNDTASRSNHSDLESESDSNPFFETLYPSSPESEEHAFLSGDNIELYSSHSLGSNGSSEDSRLDSGNEFYVLDGFFVADSEEEEVMSLGSEITIGESGDEEGEGEGEWEEDDKNEEGETGSEIVVDESDEEDMEEEEGSEVDEEIGTDSDEPCGSELSLDGSFEEEDVEVEGEEEEGEEEEEEGEEEGEEEVEEEEEGEEEDDANSETTTDGDDSIAPATHRIITKTPNRKTSVASEGGLFVTDEEDTAVSDTEALLFKSVSEDVDAADVAEEINDVIARFSRRCNRRATPLRLEISQELFEKEEVAEAMERGMNLGLGRCEVVGDGSGRVLCTIGPA